MDDIATGRPTDYTSRHLFLYYAINDTQNTIRFLDTKAAFCVTLLTAMMAAAFQFATPSHALSPTHRVAFGLFLVFTLACLSMCLRVIFPTIHLHIAEGGPAQPSFFPVPRARHHWILDTLRSRMPTGLQLSHDRYLQSMVSADDAALLRSLSEEMITISLIRQVKSDRLHVAILALSVALIAFFIQLAV